MSSSLMGDDDLRLQRYRGGDQLWSVIRTPSGRLLDSVLHSAVSKTSKLLASVGYASAAAAVYRGGGGWKATDHLRQFFLLAVCVAVWGLRLLMDTLPRLVSSTPTVTRQPRRYLDNIASDDGGHFTPDFVSGRSMSYSSSGESSSSSALVVRGEGVGTYVTRCGPGGMSGGVGRALSHVLSLITDIPSTSRKYEFALSMAERIMEDNAMTGHAALMDVNRSALAAAFHRTSDRLLQQLQGTHASDTAAATWPSRILRNLPLGTAGARVAECYDSICGAILAPEGAWPTVPETRSGRQLLGRQTVAAGGCGGQLVMSRSECVQAEKLAQELLWIAIRMVGYTGAGDGIMSWSFSDSALGLAGLALSAHPRVQGPIVKVTALLLKEIEFWEVGRDARFQMMKRWLPLLCYAGRGVSHPVLTISEKMETQRAIEGLIQGLPWDDQEAILAEWLEHFACCPDSDWPDLGRSYDQWCRSSRRMTA